MKAYPKYISLFKFKMSLSILSNPQFSRMFNLKQFRQDVLDAVNYHRERHCVPAIEISDSINEVAQTWVEFLVSIGGTHYCLHTRYGQTLYEGKVVTGEEFVEQIYRQADLYEFRQLQLQPDTDDFTQLIWKNSAQLGIGAALRGDQLYVVLFYDPPGNDANSLWANVFRPTCQF